MTNVPQTPRITTLSPKLLVGKSLRMTRNADRTGQLWGSFMPQRQAVANKVNNSFISMQVYDSHAQQVLSAEEEFTKWAAVEVSSLAEVPEGMQAYRLAGGDYAVFTYTGPAAGFGATAAYIFTEWLPDSGYRLDHREHFEILPANYRPDDANATEEVWIPVTLPDG